MLHHQVTAEHLLWGLRDRDQGWWLAQRLALVVFPCEAQETTGDAPILFAAGALTEGGQEPQRAAQLYQTPAGPLLQELAVGVDWHLSELGFPPEFRGQGFPGGPTTAAPGLPTPRRVVA